MNKHGKLIVFEGVDAAGKSSLSKTFLQSIVAEGRRAKLFAFPGNEPRTLGGLVYKIHHAPLDFGIDKMTAASLQTLHIAAHLDAIEQVFVSALENGETIVLDRFWWSTWVYGLIGGVREAVLEHLISAERVMWGRWQPSVLFYVTRANPLREEPLQSWQKLKIAYETLATREKDKYPVHIISNEGTPEEALQQIGKIFSAVIKES